MYLCMHAVRMCACYVHVCVHVTVYVDGCIHVHACMFIRACVCVYMLRACDVSVCICMCVCLCTCMHTSMYIVCTHTHTHTHTHVNYWSLTNSIQVAKYLFEQLTVNLSVYINMASLMLLNMSITH